MNAQTFVVAHGAWSAGWAWSKMRPLVAQLGATLVTPTHTGLGERSHLVAPTTDLATHIQDVSQVLEYEDLRDVILIGHSYGGMVATGVAAGCPERVAALVYVDAFVPQAGQSLVDLLPADGAEAMRARADAEGDGWLVPPNPMPPDTPEDDVAWASPRRMPQPLATFTQPLEQAPPEEMPRAYVYCTMAGPGDVFGQFAARARQDGRWAYREIVASHNPHITVPAQLAETLDDLASVLLPQTTRS
jgi:pimeloyl-ACP methyl ester carboxylesterase